MYKDYPFLEIADAVEAHASRGFSCYQKFTCDNCGSRQTIPDENVMHTKGKCEECGFTTDILKRGCNYMLIGPVSAFAKPVRNEQKAN
jgi:hypothetical protein